MSTELSRAVRAAAAAAEGDSNDREINALRRALIEACRLLGVDPETGEPVAPGVFETPGGTW